MSCIVNAGKTKGRSKLDSDFNYQGHVIYKRKGIKKGSGTKIANSQG